MQEKFGLKEIGGCSGGRGLCLMGGREVYGLVGGGGGRIRKPMVICGHSLRSINS